MRDADMIHPPRSAAGYREWAATQATKQTAGDELLLAIETRADQTLVGTLSTHNADQRAGRFSYGIGIGHDHQRRGYATDAILLLLTYMFGEPATTNAKSASTPSTKHPSRCTEESASKPRDGCVTMN